MTPFVSSTFCPLLKPAEASSAREPAARRKIESFERTSNDDASPCLARSVFDPRKTVLRARALLSLFLDEKRKEKRELFPFPSVVIVVCAKKAKEAR